MGENPMKSNDRVFIRLDNVTHENGEKKKAEKRRVHGSL